MLVRYVAPKGANPILSIHTDLNLLSPSKSRKYGVILIINQTSTPILNLAEICQRVHLMDHLLESNTLKISFSYETALKN